MRARRALLAALTLLACLAAPGVAGAAQSGALSPLTGAQGCWATVATTTEGGGAACGVAPGMGGASSTATSPDGKNVYVAGAGDSYLNLSVFRRKRVSGDESMPGEVGSLQSMGCFNDNAQDGCTPVRALRDPYHVTVSPDGLNVYVGTWQYSAIVVFARDPSDGSLTQLDGTDGCVAHDFWAVADNCTIVRGIQHVSSLVASDDGRNVYATGWSSQSVAVLDRKRTGDPGPGAVGSLTQPAGLDGCWSEDGSSGCRDGRGLHYPIAIDVAPGAAGNNPNVYVASYHGQSVAGFTRNGDGTLTQLADEDGCVRDDANDNRCLDGKALHYPRSIAVSPDGESIYVGSWHGIAILDRRDNGAMRQDSGPKSCWVYYDPNGACHQGRGLYDTLDVAVSPDGRSVYATSRSDESIASYERYPDGTLRRLAGQSACLSDDGNYTNPHGSSTGACARFDDPARGSALRQDEGHGLSISPDGRNVYVAARQSWMLAALRREAAPAPGQPTSRVWDFAEDTRAGSAADNPSDDRYGNEDVWHFGFWSTTANGDNRTGAFTPYNEPLFSEAGGVRGWKHNDRSYGSVEAWDFANGYLHTENGRVNGIGWRNPYGAAVTVTIAGQVHDLNNSGDGITWHLTEDDTPIRTRTLPPGGDATPFEIEETVAAGATIWFAVAPRGNIDYDGTEYDLRIIGPVDAQPETTISGGPRGLNEGRTHSFNLSSSGAAATTAFQCRLDGGAWEACGGAAGPAYPRAHQVSALADGPHTFQAKAVDGANEDPTPATRTFRIDDTDPDTALVGGPSGRTRDTTARFTFSSSEPGRLECRFDGGAWARCFSPVTFNELTEAAHQFEVRAVDTAGNVDTVPASRSFTVDTSPSGLQPGALSQMRGPDGCSSNSGLGGLCRDDRKLDGVAQLAVSPDGKHAYAAGHYSHSVVVYDRAASGALTQKPGEAGCVSYQAGDGCAGVGDSAYHPWDIVVSPDGKQVYVTNYHSHTVSVFDRASDGTLAAREGAAACIGDGIGECAPGRALVYPRDMTFSPDGRTLYVTSADRDTVAVIDRDAETGTLSQPDSVEACWSWSGADGHFTPNRCRDGRVLDHPRDVVVSPDGKNVYVTAHDSNAITAFRRTTTGAPVGQGVTDTTLGDLQQLSGEDGCVVNNAETEGCRRGRAMQHIRGAAVSNDGAHVYVASWSDGMAVLDRNDRNGALSQSISNRACYMPHHSDSCEQARGLHDAESIAVSPDDRTVYVGSTSDNGVTILRRDADGELLPLTGRDACWTESGNYSSYDRTGACRQGKALNQSESKGVTVSPDGLNVYVASYESDAIAVFRRNVPVSAAEPQPLEWDAANDFVRAAPGANPGPDAYGHANVWSYGRGRTAADRFTDFRTDGPGHLRMGWLEGGQDWFGAGIEDYGRFHMHPDEQGDPIVVGWTNPLSTTERFEIHALVQDNQHAGYSGDGVDWHIERGTTRLAGGTVAQGAAAQAVDLSEDVAPGETLWFTLERKANWSSDSTYFDIHIGTDEAEPGPQTTIASGPRGRTKQGSPSFTFSSNAPTAGTVFECRVDGETEWDPCGGAAGGAYPRTEVLSGLAQGEHTFRVRAKTTGSTPTVDETPATRTFTVDTAAPTTTFTAAPSGTTRDPAPRFEWTASEPGVTECRLDPPAGATADAGFEQCFSPRQLPELDDGAHTFQVRTVDRAGNVGTAVSRTFAVDTGAASLQPGALSQLQGLKGCVSETGALPGGATCSDGRALDQPTGGAMTSDGRFLYVASVHSDGVSVLERNPATGQLTQVGCVSENGTGGTCTDVRAVDNAYSVEVSPDDRFVYVISQDHNTLAAFERLPDGMLDQLDGEDGCFRMDSTFDGCTSVRGMYGPSSLAMSPDGKSLYVSYWHDYGGVAVFRRTVADGTLEQPAGSDGCVNGEALRGCEDIRSMYASDDVVVSPDGKYVYATSHHTHSVVALARDADGNLDQLSGEAGCARRDGGEGCTPVRSMYYPRRLAIAPDGANVYVASEGDYALVTLRTEPDGGLSQEAGANGCYRYDGADGCADGERLNHLTGVEVSPDGRNVYAISHGVDALTAFSRDADGRLRQLGGVDACWTSDGFGGRCRDGKGLDFGWGENIVISPDGAHVYALAWTDDDVAAFARKAPRSLTQPGDLVWDLAADWRHGADAENPLRDRYGNANVWQFRGGTGGTRAPGADGTGFTTLNPARDFGYYCGGRGFGESASDDFPLVKLGCDGGRISVHPEANGKAAIIGWRNPLPSSATVNVSGLVQDNIEGNGNSNGIDWFLERGDLAAGGEQLAAGTLSNGARGQNFDVTTTVAAGEFLWLSIDPRGAADYDMTHVDMTVSGPHESGPQTFIESGPRTVTTQARPEFVLGSDAAAATFSCAVDGAETFTPAQCGDVTDLPDVTGDGLLTRKRLRPTTMADGPHTFEVRAIAGGQTDGTEAERAFTVDSTAPETTIEVGRDGLTRDRTPTFEFSLAPVENGSFFECRVGETGPWSRCASPYTLPELSDGAHVLEVRAVDRIGNRDATPERRELQVDTTAGGIQFGALSQLAGVNGCVSQTGVLADGTCLNGNNRMDSTSATLVHPSGDFVLSAAYLSDTITVYRRSAAGVLTRVSCASRTADEGCTVVRGMDGPYVMAMDPEGKHLYVGSHDNHAVTQLDFDTGVESGTPTLSQANVPATCVSRSDGNCLPGGPGLHYPQAITVSPDGDQVYVASSYNDAIAILDRDALTGRLTQSTDPQERCVAWGGNEGCRSARSLDEPQDLVAVGDFLYVTSYYSHGVSAFKRTAAGGLEQLAGDKGCVRDSGGSAEGCRQVRGTNYGRAIDASPDGEHLYVAGDQDNDRVAVLRRDAETGELSQATNAGACVSRNGNGEDDNCNVVHDFNDPTDVQVAPDGRHVYAVARTSNSLVVLRRNADGSLRQLTGLDGCWSDSGSSGRCRNGKGLDIDYGPAGTISVSPDNASVYVAGRDSDAVAAFARRVPRAASASVQSWDLAEDFDTSAIGANPAPDRGGNSNVWTYLRGNGNADGTGRNPSTYTGLDQHTTEERGLWRDSSGFPAAYLSRARAFQVHPANGAAGAPPVVRWRNPSTETITVQLQLSVDYVACGDGVRWIAERGSLNPATGVVTGVQSLGGGRIVGGGAAQAIERTLTVAPNDIVDLVITNRTGNYSCDTTRVDWEMRALPLTSTEILDAPSELTNDETPSFKLDSTEQGATFECAIVPGTATTTPANNAFQPCLRDHTLGTLADGRYVFFARSVVNGTPEARPAWHRFKVDATKPAPTLTAPVADTSDTTPPVAGKAGDAADGDTTSADSATVVVKVYRPAHGGEGETLMDTRTLTRNGADFGPADLGTALPAGRYVARAEQEDAAGNKGVSAGRTFRVDTTKPVTTITSPTLSNASRDGRPTIRGTAGNLTGAPVADPALDVHAADENTVTVTLFEGQSTNNPQAGCPGAGSCSFSGTVAPDGTFSATLPDTRTPLVDGTYTARVLQRDVTGNESVPVTRTFKVDTVAPTVAISDFPNALTRDRTPVFRGTAGSNLGTDPSQSADSPEVRLRVFRGTDVNGQEVDMDPADEDVDRITVDRQNTQFAFEAELMPANAFPDLADGTYTAVAEQLDLAGNAGRSAPATFKVDATTPQPTSDTPAVATNDRTPDLGGIPGVATGAEADKAEDLFPVDVVLHHGTTLAGTQVDLRAGDASLVGQGTRVPGQARWTLTSPTSLTDGTYTFRAGQADLAGNTGQGDPHSFKVDATPPSPTVTSVPAKTSDRTPALSGTGGRLDGAAANSVADDGTVLVKVTRTHGDAFVKTFTATVSPATGAWSGSLAGADELPDGTYSVEVLQEDTLDNPGSGAGPNLLKVDGTAPFPGLAAPASPTRDRTPSLAGTFENRNGAAVDSVADVSAVEVVVTRTHGTAFERTYQADEASGAWQAEVLDELTDGTYSVVAYQEDELGNRRGSAAQLVKVDATAPAPAVDAVGAETNDTTPTFAGDAGGADGTAVDAVADAADVTVTVERTSPGFAVRRDLTVPRVGDRWSVTLADTGAQRLPDGTYRVTVQQKDTLNNDRGPVSARTFKVDATAPTPTLTAPGNGPTSNRRPTFTGTRGTQAATSSAVADRGTVTLEVDPVGAGETRTKTFSTNADGSWSTQLDEDLPDGSYDVAVVQRDLLDNEGRSAFRPRIKVDATKPIPVLDAITTPTNVRRPTLTGTRGTQADALDAVADATTVQIEINQVGAAGPSLQPVSDNDGTAAWSAQLSSALNDGTYDIRVHQDDVLGNRGTTDARRVKVDGTAPAPTVTSVPGQTADRTPQIAGTGGTNTGQLGNSVADDATVTVTVTRTHGEAFAKTFTATVNPANGSWSGSPGEDLPDGTYRVNVAQEDALDNASSQNGPNLMKVDGTAPFPGLDPVTSPTDDRTPSFTGTYDRRDGTAVDSVPDAPAVEVVVTRTHGAAFERTYQATETSGTWSATPTDSLPDGTYSVVAYQQDALGNRRGTGAQTVKIDDTAPLPTVDAVTNETADRTPSFAGDAGNEDGTDLDAVADAATVSVVVQRTAGGAEVVRRELTAARTGGRWALTVPDEDALPDGTYSVTAAQADAVGNASGALSARTFKVDATAPAPTVSAAVDRADRDRDPVLAGTSGTQTASPSAVADLPSLTVTVDPVGAGANRARTITAVPVWNTKLGEQLPDGSYDVTARQSDTLGNTGTSAPARRIKIDGTAPTPTLAALPTATRDRTPALSGTRSARADDLDGVADAGSIKIEIDPVAAGVATRTQTIANAPEAWSTDVATDLPDGSYDIRVLQQDAVQNEGASTTRRIKVDVTAPAPTIDSAPALTSSRKPSIAGAAGDAADTDTTVADRANVLLRITGATLAQPMEIPADVDPATDRWSAAPATNLADGRYTAVVVQRDLLDNEGTSAPTSFRVDGTGPAPTVAEPAGTIRTRTPTLRGVKGDETGDADPAHDTDRLTIRIHRTDAAQSDVVFTDLDKDGAAWDHAVPADKALADGSYEATVTQLDDLGNTATSAARTFKVDATKPAPTVDALPAATKSSAPALAGDAGNAQETPSSSADLAPVTVSIQRKGSDAAAATKTPDAANGRWSTTLDDPADGTYVISASQADAAGNVGESAQAREIEVDRTAPVPTLAQPADMAAAGADLSGTGGRLDGSADDSVADAATVTVTLTPLGGGTAVTRSATVAANGAWSVAAGTLPEGRWSATATQSDALGNAGAAGPAFFDVDRTGPTVAIDGGPSRTRDGKPSFTGTAGTLSGLADGAVADVRTVAATFTKGTKSTTVNAPVDDDGRWTATPTADLAELGGEGTWTVSVAQADAVGNSGSTSRTFVLDRTPPATTIVTRPAAFTNDDTPRFAFSADETVSRFECAVDSETAYATCPEDGSLAQLADGQHTLRVRAVDLVDNVETDVETATFTVDTVKPGTSLTTALKGGENEFNSGGFAFTAASNEEGATFECRLVKVGGATPDFASCPAEKSYDTLTDGTYRFESRATDRAANVDDTAETFTFNVDVTIPDTAITTGFPKTLTNDSTPEIRVTSPDGDVVGFECRVDSSAAGDWTTCANASSLAVLADGEHTLEVRAVDRAGNKDGSPAARTFTVDTTPPTTSFLEQPAAVTKSATARFRFGTNDGTTFECRRDDAAGFTSCPSTVDLAGLSDGTHVMRVRAVDAAGNADASAEELSWIVDTAAPAPTVTAPTGDGKVRRVVYSGTAGNATSPSADLADVVLTVKRGTTVVDTFTATRDGASWSFTTPADKALADGTYTVAAAQLDAAGNTGTSDARTFKVDATAPVVAWTTTNAPKNDATPTLSGTAGHAPGTGSDAVRDENVSITLTKNAGTPYTETFTAVPQPDGTFEVTVPEAKRLTDGEYDAVLTQADALGNEAAPKTLTFKVDTVAPVVTLDPFAAVTNDTTPSFTGGAGRQSSTGSSSQDAGVVTLRVYRGATELTETASVEGAAGTWAKTWPAAKALADGTYRVVVEQLDAAGNAGTAERELVVDTAAPQPLVDALSDPTNDTTPRLTGRLGAVGGTANDRNEGRVTVTRGTTAHTFDVVGTGANRTWTVDDAQWATAALSGDGEWTVKVTQLDAAGNSGESAARTLVLDTTAPAATITSGPRGVSKLTTSKFTYASEQGARFECRLGLAGSYGTCPSSYPTPNGNYVFQVRAVDQAGNEGDPAVRTFEVNTASSRTEAQVLAGDTVSNGGAADPAAASVTASKPGNAEINVRPGPADGAGYDFAGQQFDVTAPAGEVAAPLVLVFELGSAQVPAGATPATIEVFRNGTVVNDCPAGGSVSAAQPSCVKERGTRSGGGIRLVIHTVEASAWSFAKDSRAPTVSVTDGPTGELAARDATFRFSADEDARFECRMDGGAYEACTSPKSYKDLAEGARTFSVRATDRSGNAGEATRAFTIRLPKAVEPPKPAPGPAPGPTPTPPTPPRPTQLTDAQMQAMAQRVLKLPAVTMLRTSLGTARTFGSAEIARGRLALKRGQTKASLFSVVCPLSCTIVVTQTLTVGKQKLTLLPQRTTFSGPGAGVVALRMTSKAGKAFAKARKAKLASAIEVTDAVGRKAAGAHALSLTVKK